MPNKLKRVPNKGISMHGASGRLRKKYVMQKGICLLINIVLLLKNKAKHLRLPSGKLLH